MSSRTQIQDAIRELPKAEVAELAKWLERELEPEPSEAYKEWRKTAVGVAVPGVTTAEIMELTRGE